MMARQKNSVVDNARQEDEVLAPILLTPLHVQDRTLSKVAGSPQGWRKMSIIEHAYQHERLGEKDSNAARDRLSAAVFFTKIWDCAQKAGRDSTASLNAGGYGGSGAPLSEAQQSAIRRLVAIEMHLGRNDRMIVRGVCAWGYTLNEAVHDLAKLQRDTRVSGRVCEALDALADAIERTAKSAKRS